MKVETLGPADHKLFRRLPTSLQDRLPKPADKRLVVAACERRPYYQIMSEYAGRLTLRPHTNGGERLPSRLRAYKIMARLAIDSAIGAPNSQFSRRDARAIEHSHQFAMGQRLGGNTMLARAGHGVVVEHWPELLQADTPPEPTEDVMVSSPLILPASSTTPA